ncbi:restriction endonuclease subunit S [Acetobacter sp. UBA5411]|uniref:restriction endonuclease subunit S n=1 Tax=Acetobacter sp. UBA5411 TaxID=1945905 RepID=UPI0025BEA5C0|nr:restriction endonuclease subunit S [Acetobacter sp. UBA5411]
MNIAEYSKTVRLGDITEKKRGISYGIVQPGTHENSGVPIVRVADIRNGEIDTTKPLKVSKIIEENYKRTRLCGGELLITIVGTVGETAIVPYQMKGWNVARAVAVIPVEEEVGPYWVKLALCGSAAREIIQARLNTTVQATLNLRDLADLPIPIPPPRIRNEITALLGALDDKIDLDRRTNETLEAMARALFRDWFVDFGPTRAKMAGQTPYLASEVWELFPDRLDDEGKPEGWNFSSIYDVASVVYGAPFASSLFNTQGEGIPLVRIRDLPSEKPGVWTTENHPKGFKILPGMIVVGMDGEFRAHLWGGEEAWLNQRVCIFLPNEGISSVFLRETIIPQLKFIEDTEVATTVIHLGKGDINEFTAIVPSRGLMSSFNDAAEVFYEKIVRNKQEARTLVQLRDLLLPKLMSGEIRIRDAEKMVADAL